MQLASDKRKANIGAAQLAFQDIRKMPNKGLNEIIAKCKAVAEAKTTLNQTNSPKRPFDGMRSSFLAALNKQRDAALKVNGLKSCGAAKKLQASLPPDAPIPVDLADLDIDAVDEIDGMPLEVADAEDFEVVEAELEADVEAEEEMLDADGGMEMADGMNPAGDANPPAAAPAVEAACIISQADGSKIYSNPSTKESSCKTTCDAFAASVPDRECSFGGVAFQSAQAQICVITSADGSLVYNMMTSSGACKAKCAEMKLSDAGHSCSWAGDALSTN